jgi:5'-nucleotidase
MRRLLFALLACALPLTLAAAASAKPTQGAKTETVQILAVNDFHGNLEPPSGSGGRIQTGPTTTVDAGGAEYLATHLKNLEQGEQFSYFVSAGDLVGASPLLSGLFHDEPTVEALNLMGLDFNGVGNHEFDEGTDELRRLDVGGCHPVDGCQDGTPFFGSIFQFLAANVIVNATANPLFPPYEIVNVRGTKIAFIGETLQGTPEIVTPTGVAGLTFLDEADAVNMLIPHLRPKAEVIVLLLHEGGQQNPAPGGFANINGCENLTGPVIDVVNRLDDEVDVVASAHTHQPYVCTIDGKLVTSASSFGRLITDIELTISRPQGDVVAKSAVNRIVTRDVAKDPAITELMEHYAVFASPIANEIVGSITADIIRAQNAAGESPLGDVIADAQLEATLEEHHGGAVIALMNPGGIRADLTYSQISGSEAPGQVTFGELFNVQPFGNALTVKTCTGAQIETILEQQFEGADRILQVSGGFTYTWSASAPDGSKIDPASIKLNGSTLGASTPYRVEMNSFLAAGGDRFPGFNACTEQLGGELDLDALVRYIRDHSPVPPGPANRITRIP